MVAQGLLGDVELPGSPCKSLLPPQLPGNIPGSGKLDSFRPAAPDSSADVFLRPASSLCQMEVWEESRQSGQGRC